MGAQGSADCLVELGRPASAGQDLRFVRSVNVYLRPVECPLFSLRRELYLGSQTRLAFHQAPFEWVFDLLPPPPSDGLHYVSFFVSIVGAPEPHAPLDPEKIFL